MLILPLKSRPSKGSLYFTGYGGCGNNWAKGHYTLSAEIKEDAMNAIRKSMEMCEQAEAIEVIAFS